MEAVIETRHLKIFVAIYRARSFTKAAKDLNTSQPTVSEHLQNLETSLGVKLFDRLGRTILPTAEAEFLYPRAQAILDDLEKLREDLSASVETVSGPLVIGASTIPGTYLLPRLAAEFKEQFPKTSFDIRINDTQTIAGAVADHELYAGVIGAKTESKKLAFQEIAGDELILAAAADNPVPPQIDFQQLQALPYITREPGSGTRKSTEVFLKEKGLLHNRLTISATLGSSVAVKEAIKSNLGVSIISRLAIQDELEAGRIRQIELEGIKFKRTFYLVTARGRTIPTKYQRFILDLITRSRSLLI